MRVMPWNAKTPEPGLSFLRALQQEGGEQGHRASRCALLLAGLPGRTCDVEVRPVVFAREAREEARRCDGAARATADVGEVREIALQLLLVILPDRQPPGAIPGFVAGRYELARERILVGEQARADVAQGDDAGSRERGDIDDGLRLETLGVGESVAQDQPSFGVGVQD